MCTLTLVPNNKSLIITSNRDEHVSRGVAEFPIKQTIAGNIVTFPKDPLAGGTWIAASQDNITVLLNGGLENHAHKPPYTKSRGVVVLDRFKATSFNAFTVNYNLNGIEPFTMVNIHIPSRKVSDLIWTGSEKLVRSYPSHTPLIWSSSTLYNKQIRKNRSLWFNQWISTNKTTAPEMIQFHQFDHGDRQNGILMDRKNGLRTVSISQIEINHPTTEDHIFTHNNLLNNTQNSTMF